MVVVEVVALAVVVEVAVGEKARQQKKRGLTFLLELRFFWE